MIPCAATACPSNNIQQKSFLPMMTGVSCHRSRYTKRIIPRPQTYDSCLSSGGSDEATVPVTTFTQPVKPGKSLTHVYKILDTSWHCPHAMQYSYDSPATLENLPHSESWLLRLDCLNIVGSLNIFISEMNRSHCKL